jgi:hypothetical protein
MPEVRGEEMEGRDDTGKKERKSFRYLEIEREFLRVAVLAQESYPCRILALLQDRGE